MNKKVEKLSSHALLCQMIIESLTIAQAQLVEKFPANSPGNVLMTDGTTKYGHHYSTYAVSTNGDINYTMGLCHTFLGLHRLH